MPSSLQLFQKIHNTQDLHKPYNTIKCPTIPPSISSPKNILHHHTHILGPNQCSSAVVQTISASVSTVWSLVRKFKNPQTYKHFLTSCHIIVGDGSLGSLWEVYNVSGLPADCSRESLDILDDERYVMSFSIVGGNHRLNNYRSVTTLHAMKEGNGTVVVESYVVDVPMGNTKEETYDFTDTIVRCNLQSLANDNAPNSTLMDLIPFR